jgi:very-short-patch-repair endonuclease
MTDAAGRLWARLRGKQLLGVQFYRQKPLGNSIVDFYAPKAHLVIEVDGGQHFEPPQQAADAERTAMLSGMGLRVVRFTNNEVLAQTDAVVEAIVRVIAATLSGDRSDAAVPRIALGAASVRKSPGRCASCPLFQRGRSRPSARAIGATKTEALREGVTPQSQWRGGDERVASWPLPRICSARERMKVRVPACLVRDTIAHPHPPLPR